MSEDMQGAPVKSKLLSVCIIGKPNAGKSTLLNRLVGQKISIVTPKVQTTRSIITGVVTHDDVQLIFFDTPGIFEPRKRLEKAMVRCAWSSISSADKVVLIIDGSRRIDEYMEKIISRIKEHNLDLICLLNKADVKENMIGENHSYIEKELPGARLFTISATEGSGVEAFEQHLLECAKHSPWHYGEDDITNLPLRFLASEMTREQLFLKLKQELPYNLTVESEGWIEQKDNSIKVNQVIIVTREAYKRIILGKNGEMIKKIGMRARKGIEALTGQKVHLFLFVKVRKDWEDKPESYDYMGLRFKDSR